jgi:hypothetical protein
MQTKKHLLRGTKRANAAVVERLEGRRLFTVFSGGDDLTQTGIGPFANPADDVHLYDTTFALLDTNGIELATFGTGAVINLQRYGSALNIRAKSLEGANSVRFDIDGVTGARYVGQAQPYLAYAAPTSLATGVHIIVARMTRNDGRLDMTAVQFTVTDEPVLAPAGRLSTDAGSVDFGDVPIGESVTKPITVSNPHGQGEQPVAITFTNIRGFPSFAVDPEDDNLNGSFELAPGQSRTLNVTFAPRAEQHEGQTLLLISSDNKRLEVTLLGTGADNLGTTWSTPDQIEHTVAPNPAGAGRVVTVTWHTAEPDAPAVVSWWRNQDAIFNGKGGEVVSSGPGGAVYRATFVVPTNDAYSFRVFGKGNATSETMNV